ncbi:MAG: hypothetical protein COA79_04350 [Planctomycetota bacterium]|nr:MAG: hypothetical protein COA79_04350 [Planctomycetota bacterium]
MKLKHLLSILIFNLIFSFAYSVPGINPITHTPDKGCVNDGSIASWSGSVSDGDDAWVAVSGKITITNTVAGSSTGNQSIDISGPSGTQNITWSEPGYYKIHITMKYKCGTTTVTISNNFNMDIIGPGYCKIENPDGHDKFTLNPDDPFDYPVGGKTLADVLTNIPEDSTAEDEDGNVFAANQFGYISVNGNDSIRKKTPVEIIQTCTGPCQKLVKVEVFLRKPIVSLTNEFNFPKWTDYNKGSCLAKKEWDRYLIKVKLHENNHKKISIEMAKKLAQKTDKLRVIAIECTEQAAQQKAQTVLVKEFLRIIEELKKEHKAKQKKYDADTNHGESEGAKLDKAQEGPCPSDKKKENK